MSRPTTSPAPAAAAAPPPEGVAADPGRPEDVYHTAVLASAVVCAGVVNVAFGLHAYVKLAVRRTRLLHEDGFCVASWLLVNSFLATTLTMALRGEGRQIWEVSMANYKAFLKALYINSCFYSPAAFCTKVTLLLLIARVFAVRPVVSRGIRVFILTLLLAYTILTLLKIFTCSPVSAYWEMPQTAGVSGNNPRCLDQSKFFMGDIVIAVVTDFLILILPIPLAWSMEAPWRRKIKIVILLGAGGAATATTVMRAYLNTGFSHSTNVTKDFSLSSITSVLELSIGLLCACLPSVNLLLEKASSGLAHSCLSRPGRRRAPDDQRTVDDTTTTASSYWSSLKSRIVLSTMRTRSGGGDLDGAEHHPGRWSRAGGDGDVEMLGGGGGGGAGRQAQQHPGGTVVVFNNRLDVPSIRSSSDDRWSRSSKDGEPRHGWGLPGSASDARLEDDDDDDRSSGTSASPPPSDVPAGRGGDGLVTRRDDNVGHCDAGG